MRAPGGAGVGGAVVTLSMPGGERTGRAVTDPDGGYEFHLAAAGSYLLAVAGDGLPPAVVPVEVGDRPLRRDVVPGGGAELRGRVTSAGVGVPHAHATLVGADGSVAATAVTGPDGEFRFGGLPAGGYTVTAAGPAPDVRVVRVEPGTTTEVRLVLGA